MSKNGDDAGVLCIRMLRDAEIRGQQVIAAARDRKLKRIKQAKIEAEAEVNEYRQKRETSLLVKQDILEREGALRGAKITDEAKKELERMDCRVKACTPEIAKLLENLVCYMKPDVHHNIHVRRDIDANDDYARDYLDSDPTVEKMLSTCILKCEMIASNLFPDDNNNKSDRSEA